MTASAIWQTPCAAIPLAMGRSYDSAGIGMTLGAGPVYDSRHGLAPNDLISQAWFHYYPTVLGGAGLDFSSRNPSDLQAFNQTRYDVTSTWIPSSSAIHAVELSGILSVVSTSSYLDTIAGAPPINDDGLDIGLSARIAYGRRLTETIGWWISGAPGVAYRIMGTNPDIDPSLDAETGMTFSLRPIWHDAHTLCRAWDIFVRIPFSMHAATPYLDKTGAHREPTWSLGLQIGPSGLF